MNIICGKQQLLEGINIVLKAVPNKSTMEILDCIVIEVKEGRIKLTANDLEIGIETIIEGRIIEEGSVAAGAKVLSEIVRKLPSDEVNINVDNNYNLNISCGKAKFNISAKSAEEFPFLPQIYKQNKVVISQFTLKEIIFSCKHPLRTTSSAAGMITSPSYLPPRTKRTTFVAPGIVVFPSAILIFGTPL